MGLRRAIPGLRAACSLLLLRRASGTPRRRRCACRSRSPARRSSPVTRTTPVFCASRLGSSLPAALPHPRAGPPWSTLPRGGRPSWVCPRSDPGRRVLLASPSGLSVSPGTFLGVLRPDRSALRLLPPAHLGLSALAAVYGGEYMRRSDEASAARRGSSSISCWPAWRWSWSQRNACCSCRWESCARVLLPRHVPTTRRERPQRGWTYLVATISGPRASSPVILLGRGTLTRFRRFTAASGRAPVHPLRRRLRVDEAGFMPFHVCCRRRTPRRARTCRR